MRAQLRALRAGAYTLSGNHATGFQYGIKAAQFDDKVQWTVFGDDWGSAQNPVYYDDTVANQPSDQPLPPGPGPYDDAPTGDAHQH